MFAWNLTEKNLCVVLNGKAHTIARTADHFGKVMDALDREDEGALENLMNAKSTIESGTEGRISFDGHNLYFNGEIVHNTIVNRLHYLWSNGYPYKPLLRFMDNLMDNPSYRAVNELYGFLEATDLPITKDGHFLAYKKITSDFKDIYTRKIDNSVGVKVSVPRNKVDEDSTRTCSYGLHVCSRSYLPCFGYGGGDKVVLVKVNPANVVAVPADYNNAKMRVCAYEVVEDISDQFRNNGRLSDAYYTEEHSDDVDELEDDSFDELDDLYGDVDELEDDPFDDLSEGVCGEETPAPAQPGPSVHATSSKLNQHQVRDIKRLLKQGDLTLVEIAALHDVNESTIRKIRNGETWTWVTI